MDFREEYMFLEKRLKRQILGREHFFRVLSPIGFEGVLAGELNRLGIAEVKSDLGTVFFHGKLEEAIKICAFSRSARRVDMKIDSFRAENFGKFEKKWSEIPFELYLPKHTLPSIQVKCKKSRLYHSDAISERAENILKEKSFTDLNENQKVYIDFENDKCEIFIGLSGEPLYKRGLSRYTECAPLQETLAYGILQFAGAFCAPMLIDPMCGSGTFSLETASVVSGLFPAKTRKFAFMEFPSFKENPWKHLLKNPPVTSVPEAYSIWTSDKSEKAIETVLYNTHLYHFDSIIHPVEQDFLDSKIIHPEGALIVLNPPYGIRMKANTETLYKEIRRKIRSDYKDCKIALICPTHKILHSFAPSILNAIRTNHGGLDIFVIFTLGKKL